MYFSVWRDTRKRKRRRTLRLGEDLQSHLSLHPGAGHGQDDDGLEVMIVVVMVMVEEILIRMVVG